MQREIHARSLDRRSALVYPKSPFVAEGWCKTAVVPEMIRGREPRRDLCHTGRESFNAEVQRHKQAIERYTLSSFGVIALAPLRYILLAAPLGVLFNHNRKGKHG